MGSPYAARRSTPRWYAVVPVNGSRRQPNGLVSTRLVIAGSEDPAPRTAGWTVRGPGSSDPDDNGRSSDGRVAGTALSTAVLPVSCLVSDFSSPNPPLDFVMYDASSMSSVSNSVSAPYPDLSSSSSFQEPDFRISRSICRRSIDSNSPATRASFCPSAVVGAVFAGESEDSPRREASGPIASGATLSRLTESPAPRAAHRPP